MGRAIQLCDLTDNGVLPVAGGALDQSSWFISLCTWLKSEDSRVMEESAK